ncbi:MAG: hypothetical protein RL701_6300 [Pseudomonadota bacterium]|jgi:hypothetical protein
MDEWKTTDIRRTMPRYVEREGDMVYNAPYRVTEADLNVVVLSADIAELQTLVDLQLNALVKTKTALLGSQRGLHFDCRESWIALIYAALRSVSSVAGTDRDQGHLGAFELSIWVPIVKRHEINGSVFEEHAWFLPLVYTAPTASVVTGREIYGYPKVPAYLALPEGGDVPVAVQTRESFEGDAIKTERFFAASPPNMFGRPAPVTPREHPLLGSVVQRYLANLPLIFRKQAGLLRSKNEQGEPLSAQYSSLIESRVPMAWLGSFDAVESGQLDVGGDPDGRGADVARALGIANCQPQFQVALRNCTLDIQQGREIWVAAERAPYIAQLPAPGNSLINRPAGSEPNALDLVKGVAEVYFARARPHAIAALLARHFPATLREPRPIVGSLSDSVALLFLRAEGTASVRLYEFGVWIPVLECAADGTTREAWYAPYLFRSPGASVVHARECYGHPCQEAFIDFADEQQRRVVSLRRPIWRGAGGPEWIRQEGIVFEETDSGGADIYDAEKMLTRLTSGEQRIVALMQVRHSANTERACLQQIIGYDRHVSGTVTKHEPLVRKVTLAPHLQLEKLLDLDGPNGNVAGYRLQDLIVESTPPIA